MKARKVKGLDPAVALRANASLIVQTRLDELRGFAERALAPDASTAQHDMRIAAKRLRYVLEVVGPCFGEEANAARKAARDLQGVLGGLHDCDLMLPKLAHIESLAAVFHVRREALYHRFVELWQAEASVGAWAALERIL